RIFRALQLLARPRPGLPGDDRGGERAVLAAQGLDHREAGRIFREAVVAENGLGAQAALAQLRARLRQGRGDHRVASPLAQQQAHRGVHLHVVVDVDDGESLEIDARALSGLAPRTSRFAAHKPRGDDQPEGRAHADLGLALDRVFEEAGQALDDRQPQAQARVPVPAPARLEELLEDRLAVLRPDARAGVAHPYDDRVAAPLAGELDAPFLRVLDRVVDQVAKDALEQDRVRDDHQLASAALEAQ